MRLILGVLSLLLLAPGIANAQAADDMRIVVSGFQLTTNGAEKAAGRARVGTGPSSIGKPRVRRVLNVRLRGLLRHRAAGDFEENAHAGWRVEITPTKVADHAVTFRLRWVRALDTGKGFTPARRTSS